MPPNIFTIPASAPFAETLARDLIARTGAETDPLALTNVTIFLPTRRGARTLNDTFARILNGSALLPNVRPLGDVDEDELLFDTASDPLTLPPAITPLRRRLLLAAMVRRWGEKTRDGHMTFAQAASLSGALAKFLDEAETLEIDLAKIDKLAPEAFAAHWAEVRDFLSLLRKEWPKLLDAEGAMNPAARRNLAIRAIAEQLRNAPAQGLIVAAGSTGSIPATAELIGTIARLSNGLAVLPALDKLLDESSWDSLDPGHAQFGLKELLRRIGVAREEVREFGAGPQNAARETLLREALRPAPTTDAWRRIAETGRGEIAKGLGGISVVTLAHAGEEAAAIGLMLREALNMPRQTAALVTPDRGLARRVAAEMRRWNIQIDDSGGRPLSHTAPGTFLCLLAAAAEAEFAPVPLLALLKHPLAAGGQAPADFRRRVRQLDRFCLRGPRPDPGLAGIRAAIAASLLKARERERKYEIDRIAEVAYWFQPLATILKPLAEIFAGRVQALWEIIDGHIQAAEALTQTGPNAKDSSLWRGDAGETLYRFAEDFRAASKDLVDVESSCYPLLLRTFLGECSVRPTYGRHPRLAILGTLEARLQSFDLVILGGLNEGSWPAAPEADSWLSRPMRAQLGLDSPERRIGQAAHDFAMLTASPRVILTRPQKADGAPTVPARWLQRVEQLTSGLGLAARLKAAIDYATLAAMRDDSDAPTKRTARPRPCPPVSVRPRRLSVTEIETWLRDPYAIYAKHVLRLRPLDRLDGEIGPLERGTAIHSALETFLREIGAGALPNAERLISISKEVFTAANLPKAIRALWEPRFIHAANWFATVERKRSVSVRISHLEIKGESRFDAPGGDFFLRATADRIDEMTDGTAAVVDYKTGSLPTPKQVTTLLTPQLPLEGVILVGGGFPGVAKGMPSELVYIRLSGGAEPGKLWALDNTADLVDRAKEKLLFRVAVFDEETTPYLPRVAPYRADISGDYDHLARVREWSVIGWEAPEE